MLDMIEEKTIKQIVVSVSMRLLAYAKEYGLSESGVLDCAIDILRTMRDSAYQREMAEQEKGGMSIKSI